MSNETIKLEADCAVATYNHLHHHHHNHHHHHPHQNPHLQHHHNPIPHHNPIHHNLVPPHEEVSKDDAEEEEEEDEEEYEDELIDGDEEQENKDRSNELIRLESCKRGHIDHSSNLNTIKLSGSTINEQISLINQTNGGNKLAHSENVSNLTPLEQPIQKDVIRLHQNRQNPPPSNSPSSSVDSSESSEDDDELESDEEEEDDERRVDQEEADDEYAEDDDDEDEDEDGEDEAEEEDDDDEEEDDDEDEDSDAIVDPVGHHQYLLSSGDINSNCTPSVSGTNHNAINNLSTSANDEEYDDVTFANGDYDDPSVTHNSSTPDLLNSERMLEVTRKLVRSTERDPDRDLRKQVLLRTAIRKLPHFMEYNHYSDTFDQNFRLHNNTINDNNNTTALECLSPTQYYEHHSIHHLEPQPKSYYHSVQPNAIQMSTTSLRMLDLNDDPDAEFVVTNPIETKHHHMSYEGPEHVAQVNLDQQHDYANSNLYNPYSQHDSQMNQIQDQSVGLQSEQRPVMHDFNQYSTSSGSGNSGSLEQQEPTSAPSSNLITRHDTLDNLYQAIETGDVVENPDSNVEPSAFQTVQDYSRVCPEQETYEQVDDLAVTSIPCQEVKIGDIPDLSRASDEPCIQQAPPSETAESKKDDHIDTHDHQYLQRNDCNDTITTACHDSNEPTRETTTHNDCNNVSLSQDRSLDGNDSGLIEDKTNCIEGSSNSSQSSTSSEDSATGSSSHSNDSAGDINGISILETSLNSTNDYQHISHDSGVSSLYSPRANKRTSSSIGLDDEMEIDHLSEMALTPTDQTNTGTVANHCKKLRKKELVD